MSDQTMSLDQVRAAMRANGARELYVKFLSPNDNSKNQIYLGGDFRVINVLPAGAPIPAVSGSRATPIFKAPVRFLWIDRTGAANVAPDAQMILYPQYPEVRLSGFLRGAEGAPNDVLTVRDPERVLLLGVTADGRILGFAANANSPIAAELRAAPQGEEMGVLLKIPLASGDSPASSRARLLEELCRVSQLGWIDGWRLRTDGSREPCIAQNCVGVTLESELGITANGRSEPDFEGWEVKAHTVANLSRQGTGAVTLMTPEPTGGEYRAVGIVDFVTAYGYQDKRGRENRLNFGGIHRVGIRCSATGLTLAFDGYDAESGKMTRADGSLALLTDAGSVAASWDFVGLLAHWSRKHSRAVFVPAIKQRATVSKYTYGSRVLLAEGTDYSRVLRGLANGTVYYDPGIKVENESGTPKAKKRSQFRVARSNLRDLYHSAAETDTCVGGNK